jgi:high-affinity nickel permease
MSDAETAHINDTLTMFVSKVGGNIDSRHVVDTDHILAIADAIRGKKLLDEA